MKIAIIVGHRRSKQGSYGNTGISEFRYWSKFATELNNLIHTYKNIDEEKEEHTEEMLKMKKLLENIDTKVFYRRDQKGYRGNMIELHKRLDAWGANLSMELHFNRYSDVNVTGHEVLFHTRIGQKYAKLLNDKFNAHLENSRDRNIKKIISKKQRGGEFLLRGASECILTEPFFASHHSNFLEGTENYDNLISSFLDFIVDSKNVQ